MSSAHSNSVHSTSARGRKFGLRARLALASLALVLVSFVAVGIFLEHAVGIWTRDQARAELLATARTARELLVDAAPGDIDRLADRLGAASGARVTVIAPDGHLLGDSLLDAAGLAAAENHGDRPEVAAARTAGEGFAERRSVTLGHDMLYAAVPIGSRGETAPAVVRAAHGRERVEALEARLLWALVIAGVVALGGAALIILLSTQTLTRGMNAVVARIRGLAAAGRGGDDGVGVLRRALPLTAELEDAVDVLAADRDRFRAVLQGMSDGVIAVDDGRRILLLNQAARELLALDESVTGQPLEEAVGVPELGALLTAAVERRASADAEFELGGLPRRHVAARATVQRSGGGVVLVLQDVTELRRLETVRRHFVANVSHELRTPVSVIAANAETLLGEGALDDRESAQQFLEAIERNAVRLSRLIADLLDLSRIESGAARVELRPVALGEAVERGLEAVATEALERHIRVTADISDELVVSADEGALDQVLLNLLGNAVKYTPEGGEVTLRAVPTSRRVRLDIIDTGPGIAPEHRVRIFERFYRVDPGRSRKMGGTGLGLAIVKHLVFAMKGRVGVEPVEPRGSRFWVSLRRVK